jgi:RND family efflux transporter MFP subunit
MYHSKRLTTAALALWIQCAVWPSQAENQSLPLHTVTREAVPVSINIAGTVAALKTAQLTAQVPGRIIFIAGQEGDRFRQGDELIRIDDSALRAKLDAAVAQRDAALAAIRNSHVQLQRELVNPRSEAAGQAPGGMGMPAMMDQMFTNPMQNMMGMRSRGNERYSDVISRETQVAQATTQHKQAEAQIKEIQAALRDARSLAPFDGVIETLQVETGDTMQPGQPLLTFSETTAFQVHADVPVRLRPGLREGMQLPVRLDGRGSPVPARVSRIFPVADPNQHTVRVEMDLPLGTPTTVGQYAEVRVPDQNTDRSSSLYIPLSSVVRKGGLPLVFTVGDDGKTRLRVVRLGEQAGDRVAVLSGVKEGDLVVASPTPGLRAGTPVAGAAGQDSQ